MSWFEMFNAPIQLTGAVATALVTLLVLWKGGTPERIAVFASLAAYFISPAAQKLGGLPQPLWGVAAVDATMLGIITLLIWFYDRQWLIGAWAAEALTLLCHVAKLADVTLLARGYVASLYILYFGFLASLAWGAFEASARRARAASA
jgi:hypothetical protein